MFAKERDLGMMWWRSVSLSEEPRATASRAMLAGAPVAPPRIVSGGVLTSCGSVAWVGEGAGRGEDEEVRPYRVLIGIIGAWQVEGKREARAGGLARSLTRRERRAVDCIASSRAKRQAFCPAAIATR